MDLVHVDAQDMSLFKAKASADTGFYARYVAEHNYDEVEGEDGMPVKGNRPNGGIRRDGPHKEMTDFVDNMKKKRKLLLAPRGSMKSTTLGDFCCRLLCNDRDTTILYMMETEGVAKEKVREIQKVLESKAVTKTYGQMKGEKWSDTQLFVNGRSENVAKTAANLKAGGVGSNFTGQHYRVIILDDIVTWDTVRNADQIAKTMEIFKMIMPLLDPMGILIVCGTRYHAEDLYGQIMRDMPSFETLHLGCGMKVIKDEEGKWVLEGEPTFPHLTKEHIQDKFETMVLQGNPADFVSQYQNEIMSSAEQLFDRKNFRVVRKYEHWMDDCHAYILTDTASSTSARACFSVAALVLLDYKDQAYIVDVRMGRMQPWDFVMEFVDIVEKWGNRVFIKGATFEQIALNDTYQAMISKALRERQLTVNMIGIPRGVSDDSKERRIARLQGRFNSGNLYVVDSPEMRFYNDLGVSHTLFDPEGYKDENGLPWPDGEIVKQFVFFPRYGKNDFADALADIDSVDSKGRRRCSPAPKTQNAVSRYRTVPGLTTPVVPGVMNINGFERVVNLAENPQGQNPGGESWWDQAHSQLSSLERNGDGASWAP